MKGDFSRQTFDRTKHYNSVLMQQGRVQLDADWNEQQAIHQHRVETETQDVIGLSGAPLDQAGFEIKLSATTSNKLMIGGGRYYLDGLLCENEADVSYDEQPDLPGAPGLLEALKAAETHTAIVYLDVWKRHVTALDDPAIVEPALGGPDTTTRVKTIWQVKILPVKEPESRVVGCGSFFQEWEELVATSTGTLWARSQPESIVSTPCVLPSTAGYRGLENQLFRVEVHRGGTLGSEPAKGPTFKWSRDNGTVVTGIERINGQEVTVRDLGPDEVLSFASGQWVEITDDATELWGLPGQLLQIDSVNRVSRVIKLASAPKPLSSGPSSVEARRNPKLRRWDSGNELPVRVPATDKGFITLENGIQVKFDGPSDRTVTYHTGDYWLIPARTVTTGESGSFEWPAARMPGGIRHHYGRLAVLQSDADYKNLMVMQDCRKFFSPLTIAPALHVMGINWRNDDIISLKDIREEGIVIVLDGIPLQQTADTPKMPNSVSPSTCIVTMETSTSGSDDSDQTTPGIEVILNGTITIQNNIISWKPATDDFTKLLVGLPLQRLVRVRLKGSTIWTLDAAGQSLFLDGQAFGQIGVRNTGGIPRTDLVLPSGSGSRASDFESWFFLEAQIPPPPDLDSFTITPSTVRAGQPVTATVTLTGPAPKEPMPITLAKTLIQGMDAVTDPLSPVSVPEGQRTHTFTIQTAPAAQDGVVSLKAKLRETEKTVTLTTRVVSVTITPKTATVYPGSQVTFTASVQGSLGDPGVRFTVEGTGNVGSIVSTGKNTATYGDSSVLGTYVIVARSIEDTTKFEKAIVTVVQKPKEKEKEGKDTKKEIFKEVKDNKKEVIKERDTKIEKAISEVKRPPDRIDITRGVALQPYKQSKAKSKGKTTQPRGAVVRGRAFIRADERPSVGEPKGKVKKQARKRPRRPGKVKNPTRKRSRRTGKK
jgi:hypothetical protein